MVSIQSSRDGHPTSAQQNFIWNSSILRWNHCNIPILRKHHLEGLHEILFSINELVHSDPLDSLNLLSRKHCIAKDHVKSVFFVGIASGHCRVNNLNRQPDSVAQCKQDACADTQDGTIETDVFFFFAVGEQGHWSWLLWLHERYHFAQFNSPFIRPYNEFSIDSSTFFLEYFRLDSLRYFWGGLCGSFLVTPHSSWTFDTT